jgi:hypothetical protein
MFCIALSVFASKATRVGRHTNRSEGHDKTKWQQNCIPRRRLQAKFHCTWEQVNLQEARPDYRPYGLEERPWQHTSSAAGSGRCRQIDLASTDMGDAFNDVATCALRSVTKEGERVSSQLNPRTIGRAS